MGRPKQTDPRNQQVNVRLTRAELISVRARAAAVGMRVIDFGRLVLLEGSDSPLKAAGGPSTIERLIYAQLQRLGNNLNQLVRHVHATRGPIPDDLEPLLRDIRQILARGGARDR